jgi:nucleoside-diphosphate-sugar epimerase
MEERLNMSNLEFWKDQRVLVGGGCGFLGSYLVPQLASAGARVTVVDNMENGYQDNLAGLDRQIRLIGADLRDRSVCREISREQDAVINLAARAYGMEYSNKNHGVMLVHNLQCTLGLLQASRENGVRKYMTVSSSCVYPDDAPIPTPELPVFTGLPEGVNEGYGWAKRIQELATTYYAAECGMEVCIVRPFNPYGENYRWKSAQTAHVVPALVKRIMDGEDPLRVWGSGQQRRTLLHASDATRLMLLTMQHSHGPEPVNIGYDDDITIAELVHLICEVSGMRPKIEFDTSKPEGRFRKCADPTRLRERTGGYVPAVSLRDGISRMVEWYHRSFPRKGMTVEAAIGR